MGGGLVVGGIALNLTIFWHGNCISWVKLILVLFYHLYILLLVSLIISSILSVEHIICQIPIESIMYPTEVLTKHPSVIVSQSHF